MKKLICKLFGLKPITDGTKRVTCKRCGEDGFMQKKATQTEFVSELYSFDGVTFKKKITTCLKGHKLKVVGHSCCDDICTCKCGKWMRCGLGGIWRIE